MKVITLEVYRYFEDDEKGRETKRSVKKGTISFR